MTGFWNKKTPRSTLIVSVLLVVTTYISILDRSPQLQWAPLILLVATVMALLNNIRLDRSSSREREMKQKKEHESDT